MSEELCRPLSNEDQTAQSMPDVSPSKWHLAHTSWFFETFVLKEHLENYRPVHPAYEQLFNSYYHSVGEQYPRAKRGLITRPGTQEVLDYRKRVDEKMALLLEAPSDEVLTITELGLQHEQQHQELIVTDIKHVLSQNPLDPVYRPGKKTVPERPFDSVRFLGFAGGVHEIGHEGTDFCFDNEKPRHRVLLGDFELAHRPITNGEVIAFIEEGGYQSPLLWLSDGWSHCTERALKAPLYWKVSDGNYSQFTLHGRVPVDPSAPACHLSFFEAEAIARFLNARLPTEQEWEVAMNQVSPKPIKLDLEALHPSGPSPRADGGSTIGLELGGVWEWTQSPYLPYPGFRPEKGAVGEYNGKFMHNQMVLRGGSCATPTGHVRTSYRNFFPSHAKWQFSGARLARGGTRP